MPQYSSTTTSLNEGPGQKVSRRELQHLHPPFSISIHSLDNDSLLNVFRLCRPNIFHENQDLENRVIRGGGWGHERWWYKPVQVCRRWRNLILASAIHLHLCLVCTHGTPVANMLAHSPPFPLIIDLDNPHQDLTTEDEEGITLALQYRDRVRCIHLEIPVPSLQKLLKAIDGEFPMLEYMHIAPPTKHNTRLILPPAFGAPHLRHLVLYHFASPIGSLSLTTAVGLVTLLLRWIHPFTYPHPNYLLEALSHLPQLETLQIGFRSPIPSTYIKRELLRRRVVTHVTLPNLHWFSFAGVNVYLEAILPHMTTPLLETLKIHFFNQLSYAVPRLLQFTTTTNGLRFSSARFCFHDGGVAMWVFPYSETTMFAFYIHILCEHLDWQISSMAQIFNVLEPAFSTVVELTLDYTEHSLSEEWHNQVDGALWQKLLGSFKNVKTLRVHEGLIGEISRSLPLDEEPPLTLLPKLEVLVRPEGSHYNETFAPFIHQRLLAHQRIDLSSSAFPVGRIHYVVQSPAGLSHIRPVDRETSIDTRRWRDDGKREERLAARRELRDKEYRERVRDREKERGFP